MSVYKVERLQWVAKQDPDNKFDHGYDETYYDTVLADLYSISDKGVATFFVKTPITNSISYTTQSIASYADGEWKTIKDVTQNESNASE